MIVDSPARITHTRSWGDYFLIGFESPEIAQAAKPGQFLMVRVSSHPFPLLRRPFSIHDRNGSTLEIFFQVSGLGTSILAEKKEGEIVDILGPLGNGFGTGRGKRMAAVGGGRGIAPLYFLARALRERETELTIYYGGRTQSDIPLKDKFEAEATKLLCSTDDGSEGYSGLVTELFESEVSREKPDYLFACGPDAMMERLAGITQAHGIPAEFSLESIMGCGFGACWGCVKSIRRDEKEEWLKRDPLLVMKEYLISKALTTEKDCGRLQEEVAREVAEAIEYAQSSPDPDPESALRDVYA